MADLPLQVVSSDATTVTLGWTPVAGAVGYKFLSGGKTSHTWNGERSTVRVAKGGEPYKVQALLAGPAGSYPPPPPDPPPPPATANLYVSPTGSDSASGTQAAPLKSFAKAYEKALSGAVVAVMAGNHGEQRFAGGWQSPQPRGSKTITFRGDPGNVVRLIQHGSDNVHFDGIVVDANRGNPGTQAFDNGGGDNCSFKNGSIGNITDQKGAQISGANFTLENTLIHDVRLVTDGVHNEGIYAIVVPGFTIRGCEFKNCVTMDLAFTYGSWWTPLPPQYGNVTIENNKFGRSVFPDEVTTHYIGVNIGRVGPSGEGTMNGWKIRNNWFENDVNVNPAIGTGNVFCGNTGECPDSWKAACSG